MKYTVYGQITNIKKGLLALSTGHEIHVDSSDMITDEGQARFIVGQTRFFTVQGEYKLAIDYHDIAYIDSKLINYEDVSVIATLSRNLDQQTDIVIEALKALNNHDRGLILKAAGIAVSGTVSATAAASWLYQGYELCTGGPFNPLNWAGSAGIAVTSAAYCAFLYEQLSCDYKRRAYIVKRYQRAQQAYSRMMLKYMPINGSTYTSLNPVVNSLIGKARVIFNVTVYKARAFWHNSMKAKSNYASA